MKDVTITDSILYIGVDDKTLDLFESQYIIPNGVSYNSYVILDEKVAVMDTVDARATDEWLANLETVLAGRTVDYLVVSHMEPDHASNIKNLMDKYPNLKVVGNAKTFAMIPQFFDVDISDRTVSVKEGDKIKKGEPMMKVDMDYVKANAPSLATPVLCTELEENQKVRLVAAGEIKKDETLNELSDKTYVSINNRINENEEFKKYQKEFEEKKENETKIYEKKNSWLLFGGICVILIVFICALSDSSGKKDDTHIYLDINF